MNYFLALEGRYYVRKPFENIDLLYNITEIVDMNSLQAKLSMTEETNNIYYSYSVCEK